MRVFIAGATGFIGKKVCERMAIENHSILAISRSANPQTTESGNNKISWIKSDLNLTAEALDQIRVFEPEVVIDLAWDKIPDFSFDVCFDNLKSQVSFCKVMANIPSVKKLIIAGSCREYNKQIGECSEDDNYSSSDYFTWTKNSLHDFLKLECASRNIVLAWTRIFYVYGPSQRDGSLIPTLIKNIAENKVPDLRTPKNANDFIHIDDVADAFEKMISQKIPSGNYNLGSGRSVPVVEICRMVENAMTGGSELTGQLEINSHKSEKNIDFRAAIQTTGTRLNWSPSVSIEDGIKETVASIIKAL